MATTRATRQARTGRPASADVAAAIRRHVHDQRLQAGDRLGREVDLAQRFGVSRATLREALRQLAGEHLVRAVKGPGGGIFVVGNPHDGLLRTLGDLVARLIQDDLLTTDALLEARRMFEVPVAGLAAQRSTPEGVERLRAILADADRATDEAHFADLDGRLHAAVAALTGNSVIAVVGGWIATTLQPRATELVARAVVEEVIAEQHQELVDAIEQRDAAGAEDVMRAHLAYVADLVALMRTPSSSANDGGETPPAEAPWWLDEHNDPAAPRP